MKLLRGIGLLFWYPALAVRMAAGRLWNAARGKPNGDAP